MHESTLSELSADLDRAAEDAAGQRPAAALRLLALAADLRHLQTLIGVEHMGQVATVLHRLNQQIIQANADRDAAKADAAKARADADRLASLTAAGRVLDDADVAALAEADAADPGTGNATPAPGGTTPIAGDPGAPAAPGGDGAAVVPPSPAEAPAATETAPAPAADQPTA